MMKRNLYLGLLVFGIALLALAVAAPNFSGTWIRDKAKSDPMGMGRPGGGGGGGGQAPDVEVTLTIKQDANSFETATQRGDRPPTEAKYTLDGKESTNAMGRGGSTVSKAKLSGDTLVIEGVRKFSGPNGDTEMPFKEEYSLSADGKVLTVISTSSNPQGEQQTRKQVYNKK